MQFVDDLIDGVVGLGDWRHGRLGVIAAGGPGCGFARRLGREVLGLRRRRGAQRQVGNGFGLLGNGVVGMRGGCGGYRGGHGGSRGSHVAAGWRRKTR